MEMKQTQGRWARKNSCFSRTMIIPLTEAAEVFEKALKRGALEQRSLLDILLLILVLGISNVPAPTLAASSDAGILAYGIEKRKFEELVPGTNNKLHWVEKCVFSPIVDNRIKDSIFHRNTNPTAKAIVQALEAEKEYYVVKNNKLSPIRFGRFYVFASEIAYFASSEVPKDGCGQFMIFSKSQLISSQEPSHIDQAKTLFKKNERQLFTQAFQQLPRWVSQEDQNAIRQHDLARSYDKSRKSPLRIFFDGSNWHLVRTYSMDNTAQPDIPTTLNVLIMNRVYQGQIDPQPLIVFVSTKTGEGWQNVEYFGGLNLDGTNGNEIVLRSFAGHFSSVSYISKQDGFWE